MPAFDDHHPPSAALVDDCVHCGFCLTTCPTYSLWGEEMDSPRGRIQLIKQGLEGEPMTDSMVTHFDACLGCMACVTACPSGVQYDRLIERTRAQVERNHRRTLSERALRGFIFALFPHPRRLRALRGPLRVTQKLHLDRALRRTRLLSKVAPSLAAMEALTPRLGSFDAVPERTAAVGTRRAVVGMLTGCVQREFFPDVNAATARVLAAEGCDVIAPKRQGCCGALSAHSGREPEAQRYARALIDAFDESGVEFVVVNSAGCGSSMKEYVELLRDDPVYAARAEMFSARVRDFSEILAELGTVATRHPLEVTIAYHDACHLAHAQGIRDQPRALLKAIPGLALREIADPEICCGSAGIYSILNPEPARQLGDGKATSILATGAELLVTANPGCMMQVATSVQRLGRQIGLAHTAQVLDASIRGLAVSSLVDPQLANRRFPSDSHD
jgi:glycolate oxidase iron-sulfur subunit